MKSINIELLEKAADELRSIKNGKGDLKIGGRIEAAKALQSISTLILHLEEKDVKKI